MRTSGHQRVAGLAVLLWTVAWLQIVRVAAVQHKPDYESHPCRRECLGSTPMLCEYNFTVEHYVTLSRACYDCPFNMADCSRPHCVPADGFKRLIKVVNRMLPGPGIHVCEGDTLLVNVHNEMTDFEGTSIHWHGILQHGTPYMDGVSLVTQCPIPTHSSFQYRFQAANAGTHYWHAHAGFQRGDGIFGALVVRDRTRTVAMDLYDLDLPEHTVVVHDWLEQPTSGRFSLHHHAHGDDSPKSVLINGRGTSVTFARGQRNHHSNHREHRSAGSHMPGSRHDKEVHMPGHEHHAGHHAHHTPTDATPHTDMDLDPMTSSKPHHGKGTMGHGDHGTVDDGHDSSENMTVPVSVFRVMKGKRYRFRVISNGILNCPLRMSVDQHTMTVIATDGNDVMPLDVTSFNIFAGERYDVVLAASRPVGNFWIRVQGLQGCTVSQTAILRYHGADERDPNEEEPHLDDSMDMLNLNHMEKGEGLKFVADLHSVTADPDVLSDEESAVKTFYIAMDFNPVENYRYVDPEHYPLEKMMALHRGSHANHMYALQLNHITFTFPSSPPLSQYSALDEAVFCNETWPPRNCRREFCECVHRLVVEPGDLLELVLVTEGHNGKGLHPMHLHGHRFWVVAMDKFDKPTTREHVRHMDRRGAISRNLRDPPLKDTVLVPDAGYTIIRFRADNPGFWLFHCHVDFHLTMGMSLLLQVGEPHQMATPPRGFPRCGSWKFSDPEEMPPSSQSLTLPNSAECVSPCVFCVLLLTVCLNLRHKLW